MTLVDEGSGERYAFETLPDYLRPNLDLIFVGLNPGLYSTRNGHYFARPTNRFWPALSRSKLSAGIRAAVHRDVLRPDDDAALLDLGIGFTDVVKVPTANASGLTADLHRTWAPRLLQRLRHYRPKVACFHGKMACEAFLRFGLTVDRRVELGAQADSLDGIRVFVVPNPSPANAHFRLEDQIHWYNQLAEFMEGRLEK